MCKIVADVISLPQIADSPIALQNLSLLEEVPDIEDDSHQISIPVKMIIDLSFLLLASI